MVIFSHRYLDNDSKKKLKCKTFCIPGCYFYFLPKLYIGFKFDLFELV